MPKEAPSEKDTGSATHLGLCRHATSPCVRRIDLKWYPRRYRSHQPYPCHTSSGKLAQDGCLVLTHLTTPHHNPYLATSMTACLQTQTDYVAACHCLGSHHTL